MIFALILFLLLVVTFFLWCFDKLYAKKQRVPEQPDPWWVEYGASFFPVVLFVFALRSFVVEPFKIPSGSMIPTLLIGDFILVNKWVYGIRLPIINKKIIEISSPQRGDVMVFRYPMDPSLDYIKRVVGLPGDKVEYRNKQLFINGNAVALKEEGEFLDPNKLYYTPRFFESLGESGHHVLIEPSAPVLSSQPMRFEHRDQCQYSIDTFSCTVPEGHYFAMGDNRDASSDSRVWGFVPEENIVGKAFFIWLNFSDFKRIGTIH